MSEWFFFENSMEIGIHNHYTTGVVASTTAAYTNFPIKFRAKKRYSLRKILRLISTISFVIWIMPNGWHFPLITIVMGRNLFGFFVRNWRNWADILIWPIEFIRNDIISLKLSNFIFFLLILRSSFTKKKIIGTPMIVSNCFFLLNRL